MNEQTASGRSVTLRCAFCDTLNRVNVGRALDRPKCAECGKPFLLDRPVKVAGADLDRLVSDAEVPILVDFHADWCGPCKMMAPVLDDIARDRMGSLLVAKIDTDASPELAGRMGIRGIPTLVVFREGREAARQTGAAGRARLEDLLAVDAPAT